MGRKLIKIFYRTLNAKNKVVLDNITGGSFMSLLWDMLLKSLIELLKPTKGGMLKK